MKLAGLLILFSFSNSVSANSLPTATDTARNLTNKTKSQVPAPYTKVTVTEPEMVRIGGGTFTMGSRDGDQDERPQHRVTLLTYKMGKYEVTVKEFAAFVTATGYKTDAEKQGNSVVFTGRFEKKDGVSWRDDEEGRRRLDSEYNRPVGHVSWNDATEYCKWLSFQTGRQFRLPTDAEWEYAGGCGSKHYKYSWGNALPRNGDRIGNVADETSHPKYGLLTQRSTGFKDGYFFAAPVGSFAPNELGLYDMTGNVWEWCNDWYDVNYYLHSAEMNPTGPTTGKLRIMRGGSWYFNILNSRIPYRIGNVPDLRHGDIGFRLAETL